MNPLSSIQFDSQTGLVPAIVQHEKTGQVLMLGYMNQEALDRTLKTKKVTFWSRSKGRLWEKGEESGNTLFLKSISADCDGDTLLILACPAGPTCHTGSQSCFEKTDFQALFLSDLFTLIQDRKKNLPKGSYTTTLFEQGLSTILQKVNEESVEMQHAARKESDERLTEESADLLYHFLVLLTFKNIDLSDVIQVLKNRH